MLLFGRRDGFYKNVYIINISIYEGIIIVSKFLYSLTSENIPCYSTDIITIDLALSFHQDVSEENLAQRNLSFFFCLYRKIFLSPGWIKAMIITRHWYVSSFSRHIIYICTSFYSDIYREKIIRFFMILYANLLINLEETSIYL